MSTPDTAARLHLMRSDVSHIAAAPTEAEAIERATRLLKDRGPQTVMHGLSQWLDRHPEYGVLLPFPLPLPTDGDAAFFPFSEVTS